MHSALLSMSIFRGFLVGYESDIKAQIKNEFRSSEKQEYWPPAYTINDSNIESIRKRLHQDIDELIDSYIKDCKEDGYKV
jgi:hypothetical protein